MTERYIGLCMAAGGVVTGTDSVIAEVRHGRAKFVLVASDASERTRKQLTDKCKTYEVRILYGKRNSDALAELLGKRSACAAAAFTGRGPCENAYRALLAEDTEENKCCMERKDD